MALLGKRYILHELIGQGGMGTVHRATDRLTGQTVALKRVIAHPHELIFSTKSNSLNLQLALANEFRLMASLRHPHIVSVLDYGFDEARQPFFTMEYLPDAPHLLEIVTDLPLLSRMNYLIQVLQALAYLHRRGIIHSDLKPTNILIHEQAARVLDFGLSVNVEATKSGGETTGTLAYMAPEVLLGKPVGKAADLYAVGVIGYQLLLDQHPFNITDPVHLMQDVLYKAIDPTPLIAVHAGVANVLLRLLDKDPAARYAEANDVIAALCTAIEQPIPAETSAIRESFLQAASLIGREDELSQLKQLLDQTVAGTGHLLLLTGESGVGKSRLLEELRTLALIRGMLVLRGQEVRDGAMLYGLWRPALRWLALLVTLTPEEAAILHPLIPDLDTLADFEIPFAPIVDARTAQKRLFDLVADLFRRFTAQQPILLILEDLHWQSESLNILQFLATQLADWPLLIIGSYRDDERPDLPSQLPTAQVMKLERLSEASIEALSISMLGATGKNPELVRLLQQETEGNVFFLVEVIRALAEEAGQLDRINTLTLPQQVFVGGMQQIIQRRLAQVPPHARPLLQLAAVLGRQLELPVLKYAAPDVNLDEWLALCANVAVLEVQEDQWRFTHDKLRDAVLADLPLALAIPQHSIAAAALEAITDHEEQAPRLAYHWSQAEIHAKAYLYYGMAANQAMLSGANKEAKTYYENALAALDQLTPSPERQTEFIDLALKLARVSAFYLSDNVPELVKRALSYAQALEDETRIAQVISSLGGLAYMRGQMGEAFGYFTQGMAKAEKLGLDELLVLPYNMVGRAMIVGGDLPGAVRMLERGIQLAEKYHDLEMMTASQAFLSGPYFYMGRDSEAQALAKAAITGSETLGQPVRLAGNHMVLGITHVLCGRFEAATLHLKEGLRLIETSREPHQLYLFYGGLGYIAMRQEDQAEALRLLDEALQIAASININTFVPIIAGWRAELELERGYPLDAKIMADKALATAQQVRQMTGVADIERVLGRIALYQGEVAQAEQHLQASLALHEQFQAQALAAGVRLEQVKLHFARNEEAAAQALLAELVPFYAAHAMTWYHTQAARMVAISD